MSGPYAAVVAFATARHGVVIRQELRALGVSDQMTKRWVASGILHRVHQSVYAVGRPDLTPDGVRMAATLALGSSAVVSHASAAAMWDLSNPSLTPVHVMLPGAGRARRPGIRVHRTTTLHPDDVTTLHSIPVTSVARTCLDHAGSPYTRPARVVTVLEDAERRQIFDMRAFAAVLARNPHHPGAAKVRAALATLAEAGQPPDLKSELERGFREFIVTGDLPQALFNATVAGHMVDVFWPQWGLVVELDSREYHFNLAAFERDRIRDADLQAAGYRILRVTSRRLAADPEGVRRDILALAAHA